MATIYLVLSGTRYATDQQHGVYSDLVTARTKAESLVSCEEQDPPAEGTVASWLDTDLSYVCITAMEIQ
jgi:hypothetical protein